MNNIRQSVLKKYEDKKIEEIEDEEDRQIVEIIRWLDKEYGLGQKRKKIKGQDVGKKTFTGGEEGVKQCNKAGEVLSEAIKEQNKEGVIINNGGE